MKRRFTIVSALGVLVALMIPASSMATVTMSPAGAKFEIGSGFGGGLRIEGPLGGCILSKVSGQVPNSPANSGSDRLEFPLSLTAGSCSAGTSVTLAGEWKAYIFANSVTSQFQLRTSLPTGGAVLRFSSLPGCKLVLGSFILSGVWSNGSPGGSPMASGFHADTRTTGAWANDGATCALAGQNEALYFLTGVGSIGGTTPHYGTNTEVKNLTTPSASVVITP
jgi:hypothetical protein